MSSHGTVSIKPLVSSTRIMFGLLPGLGAMIIVRMAIHLYRPDIEDAENRIKDLPVEKFYDCYDFIIVGGGSAGAVLANRLSENADWKVLLLEAGTDETVLSEVPVLFPILQTSSIDWQFVTEPSDNYCLSMVDKRCKWPRGKTLGGSSVLNAMLYIRGNRRDYDTWADMGNFGWSWNDVFAYFLKSENMTIPEYQHTTYHSVGGPLTVGYFKYEHPITRNILEAGQQLGYEIRDVNGKYQTGFTRSHATVREGLRCSTAKSFLRPVAKRENLHISIHSLVEKVLIDEHKRAYGVKFTKRGHQRIVKASKEVILSAGAIQSPQLLMLSGIGDAEHLKEIGIYPIVHLPGVGKNLQDHVAMGGHSYLFDNPYANGTDYCFNLNTVFSVGNLIDFAVHKTGPLYSMMEAEAMAFVNTKYQDPEEDYPDIQLFIAPTADNLDGGLFGKRANGLTDETYAELYEDILFDSSFSVVPLLLRPKSRGYLKLRDANPYSPIRIYPNYYSHPDDIKIMNEGARIVQALTEQPALSKLNTRPNPHRNPGCSKYALMSDEHLECQARHHSLTIYHPVGTCAMGPVDDPNAVVDPRLRVYGVKNLRVVDGSIMPNIISGNTNAPIIMIAEKASDMVKEDWSEATYEDDYQQLKCPSQHYGRQDQESSNDGPSKVQLIPGPQPDLFNETANLFPYLPLDQQFEIPKKSEIVKETIPVVTREYESRFKEFLPFQNQYNPIQNPYATNWNNEPLNYYQQPYNLPPYYGMPYVLQPYPYWPMNVLQTTIGNSNENQIKNINKMPEYKPSNLNIHNSNVNYKQTNRNLLNNFLFKKKHNSMTNNIIVNNNNQLEEPLYYEVNDIVMPNGQGKCRVWLYYDGVKYEVLV